MAADANAKLMLVLYTYTLTMRLAGSDVTGNGAQPGFAATRLGRNSGSRLYGLGFALMRPFQISARKGAETSVYLAASEAVEGVTGKCFAKKREVQTAPASYDQSLQTRLWAKTMDLLKLAPSTADS
jgi:retinol dehydrogenase-12